MTGASPILAPPTFRSAARSSAGAVRSLNEDRYLERPDLGLWAVADGMGGHQRGDLAAETAIAALNGLSARASGYALLRDAGEALSAANASLVGQGLDAGPGAVIGCTVVALLIFGEHFACVWAGDSRAYRLRGGTLERLTRDHSLVQDLIDRGEIAPDEAPDHPHSHVVTRAMGVVDGLEFDTAYGEAEAGDIFLLCSDGLTGVLADQDIAAEISGRPLEAAADALLAKAMSRQPNDNLTFVLAQAAGLGSPGRN